MGLYNVVVPCVVGKLHYVRPTAQPIEVDDGVAAPLVEGGKLEPYRPGGIPGKTGTGLDGVFVGPLTTFEPPWQKQAKTLDDEPRSDAGPVEAEPKPRGRRRSSED